jgi:DNA-binding NarL/FixJ family response regulator
MKISVFLADDHAVVREGLRSLLQANGDITVVGEASDGTETVRQVAALKPDALVMDVAMPLLNGIEAAREVTKQSPNTKIVMLSVHSTSEHIYRAFEAGALGYVLKESTGKELVAAIRTVVGNRRYLCQKIAKDLPLQASFQRAMDKADSPLDRLSKREREVLQLVAEGLSSAEAAERLGLSVKTVETYRSRLMDKLGVDGFADLVKFAVQHGITPG